MRRWVPKENGIRIEVAVKRVLRKVDVYRFIIKEGRPEVPGANGDADENECHEPEKFSASERFHERLRFFPKHGAAIPAADLRVLG